METFINKFYVPEISEFHVGFEYEYRWFINVEENGNGYVVTRADGTRIINEWSDWEKLDVPIKLDYQGFQDCSPYNHNDLNTDRHQFRVKYLDKEDIESCGWFFTEQINNTNGSLRFEYNLHKLLWLETYPEIIYIKFYGKGEEVLFTVKNKQELQKLMKQLNIK